jgi:phosphoribosylformimino-5-aminoimidazole carboxamide ribotide isomerase
MMLIIPAIDLKNGLCVRLLQGRKADMTVYNDDPVEVACAFAAAGAEMIHVVDLDGAFNETLS